ncbi:MAG: carboxymuconolactone decarboxylase family protein [Proteobacteria bacterium]|nr:carboxymuconolactone decarboxylase family protein [Pseudomonadota bacterium]
MNHFPFHTPDSAPAVARATLTKAASKLGFVPNLYAGLANAPTALDGYLTVSDCFERCSLTPIERQVVLLATSVANGCGYCVAAHSMIAKTMVGAPADVVAALREYQEPADTRLAALAAFTWAVVEKRGWVADDPVFTRFLEAGYVPAQALEVVLGVAQKTLSNYANHLLDTPLNPALEHERWTPQHRSERCPE